jgi:hypothetical protein
VGVQPVIATRRVTNPGPVIVSVTPRRPVLRKARCAFAVSASLID